MEMKLPTNVSCAAASSNLLKCSYALQLLFAISHSCEEEIVRLV